MRWESPDGAAVTVFHLPPDGYEFGSSLPADPSLAADRWRSIQRVLAPRSATGLILLQNGADHHAPQHNHAAAIRSLVEAAAPTRVERVTLRQFAAELRERVVTRSSDQGVRALETSFMGSDPLILPTIRGELRDSYGYTWTLQGTFAARARQKRRNAHVERTLIRDAEPWAALAVRAGKPSRRHLTSAAWRSTLLSHPHDTLCGCSVDEVARAMDARLDDAMTQATGIRHDAILDILGHDAPEARTRKAEWRSLALVRNRAPRPRGGVAELEIETFLADVGVGPGSSPPDRVRHVGVPRLMTGDVPLQLLTTRRANRRTESPRHYPDNDLVEVRRVVAWVPPVAGYSITPFALDEGKGTAPLPEPTVHATSETVDNGLLSLHVEVDGTITLAAADGSWSVP
jgi:hypothetical protein